jgi:hypothetical protein
MSDRDDLADILFRIDEDSPNYEKLADAVLAAGFRRTVTPEQIESIAERMYASFHAQATRSGQAPTPYGYEPWGKNDVVTGFWLEVARAGLSVGGAE